MRATGRRKGMIVCFGLLCVARLWAGQWAVLGPDGGDVRSLSYDPHKPDHIYLGTNTGTVFISVDGARNWSRFAHFSDGESYVLDHIAIDPSDSKTIYVAAWSVENQHAGELFRSRDAGTTWEALPGMHQKSIRAMAMSASDPKVIAVGALDGAYVTRDGGDIWQHISRGNGMEIKNIESVAIDPRNPNVVYVGTWHLPWKTDDGGVSWHHINKGMIDDSDVFSIIVDPSNPSVVFASACSGIYKSDNAGELFHKVQGIPFSARRTRVLRQDPDNPNVVYAGTTEGLWKTGDGGKTWRQVSSPKIVVNDILVDPRNSRRVLLATDRSGIIASDDGAQTFAPSNHGYTHRYVSSIVADKQASDTILVGLVNDREWGGVFSYHKDAERWEQRSAGLGGLDVFALKQTDNGSLIAGTNRGMYMLAHGAGTWRPINSLSAANAGFSAANKTLKNNSATAKHSIRAVLTAKVNDLDVTPNRWLAATSVGLFISSNDGKSWGGGPVLGERELISVHSDGALQVVASRTHVLFSRDGGAHWQESNLASFLTSIRGVTVTPQSQILVASREGAFRSSDSGTTWERIATLPVDISSISCDESGQRLIAISLAVGTVFESKDRGRTWRAGPDSGYPLRHIVLMHGRYIGATPFDGVVIQPEDEARRRPSEPGTSK